HRRTKNPMGGLGARDPFALQRTAAPFKLVPSVASGLSQVPELGAGSVATEMTKLGRSGYNALHGAGAALGRGAGRSVASGSRYATGHRADRGALSAALCAGSALVLPFHWRPGLGGRPRSRDLRQGVQGVGHVPGTLEIFNLALLSRKE